MVGDDWFRRYSEAGAEILGGARARTEELIRELARAGESTQHQAQGAVVDLIGGGRRSADQLRDLVRREIANQLGALGIATTDDLKDLERRLKETPGNSGDVGTGRVSDRSAEGTHGRPGNATRRPARRGKDGPANTAPGDNTAANSAPANGAPANAAPAKKASAAERRPSGRSVKARSEGPSEKSRSSSGSTRRTANKASSTRASKSNSSRTSRSEG